MKFLHFLALIAGFTTPAVSETLKTGAIYFDSEHTLQEVLKLSNEKDNEALNRLIANHHVSTKLSEDTDIQIYLAGPTPESPAEFRFINSPTTYWTLTKFIEGLQPTPTSTETFIPNPNPTPNTPTSNATPTPTPAPLPTPVKTDVAIQERKEPSEAETPSPPLRKQYRRVKEGHSNDEGVPESEKVWHQVNGHWKWYPKSREATKKATPVPRFGPVYPGE